MNGSGRVEILGRAVRWAAPFVVQGSLRRDGWGGRDAFYFSYSEFSMVKKVLKLKLARCIRWRGTRYFEWDWLQCQKIKSH